MTHLLNGLSEIPSHKAETTLLAKLRQALQRPDLPPEARAGLERTEKLASVMVEVNLQRSDLTPEQRAGLERMERVASAVLGAP